MIAAKHVVVVGAGWAGLTAAAELARKGYRITLIEAARTAGGRARSVKLAGHYLDNGQHILLGAYSQTLAMLKQVGLHEQDCLQREPLHLYMLDRQGSAHIRIKFRPYPAPWHAITGMLSAEGLSLTEKIRFIRICLVLRKVAQAPRAEDSTVLDFMRKKHQPQRLLDMIWSPLCLAALNTPIAEASLQLFSVVIRDAFFTREESSNMLFPKRTLTGCFPQAALKSIEKSGGTVCLGKRVTGLEIKDKQVKGIRVGHETMVCDAVVLAAAREGVQKLKLPKNTFSGELNTMQSYPIITVYVQYPESVALPQTMLGVANGLNQWIIDRRCCGQQGLIACVISGPQPDIENKEHLGEQIVAELAEIFPDWPAPLSIKVIQEKRATFVSSQGVNQHRPGCSTYIKGLYLAGDYTSTGYPATIEGAIRSGLKAVQYVDEQ